MSDKTAGEVFNDLQQIANFIGKQSSCIAELEGRVEALDRMRSNIIAECSQEGCDGEPWDTFQEIALAAVQEDE